MESDIKENPNSAVQWPEPSRPVLFVIAGSHLIKWKVDLEFLDVPSAEQTNNAAVMRHLRRVFEFAQEDKSNTITDEFQTAFCGHQEKNMCDKRFFAFAERLRERESALETYLRGQYSCSWWQKPRAEAFALGMFDAVLNEDRETGGAALDTHFDNAKEIRHMFWQKKQLYELNMGIYRTCTSSPDGFVKELGDSERLGRSVKVAHILELYALVSTLSSISFDHSAGDASRPLVAQGKGGPPMAALADDADAVSSFGVGERGTPRGAGGAGAGSPGSKRRRSCVTGINGKKTEIGVDLCRDVTMDVSDLGNLSAQFIAALTAACKSNAIIVTDVVAPADESPVAELLYDAIKKTNFNGCVLMCDGARALARGV
jgi:hypothetical protein